MKKFEVSTPVEVLEFDELSSTDRALVDLAREATYRSYAPYSKFKVGAAIALDNGETITGSNQENAAFPSGTCAERSACFYAHSRFPDARFSKIAVAARAADDQFVKLPVPPCGACRQSLLEYETLAGHDVEVLLVGRDSVYRLPSIKSLLPLAFTEF
ncbi:MAG: cytidine deaminase [Muribaculaceae bacterium]|nr:cytidine deaminase [Muribaculaceae bacterium]